MYFVYDGLSYCQLTFQCLSATFFFSNTIVVESLKRGLRKR